jgi:hypothetical protein
VVVTGPKGLGKTTTLVEIVRRWDGGAGAVHVDLDPTETNDIAMAGKVLKALGLPESGGTDALRAFCKAYKAAKGKPPVILLSVNASTVDNPKWFGMCVRNLQKDIAMHCITISDISRVRVVVSVATDPRAKIITMPEMTAEELMVMLYGANPQGQRGDK